MGMANNASYQQLCKRAGCLSSQASKAVAYEPNESSLCHKPHSPAAVFLLRTGLTALERQRQQGKPCAKVHKNRVLLSEACPAMTQEKPHTGIGKKTIITQISNGWESEKTAGDKEQWRFSQAARHEAETNAACETQAKTKKP